MVSIPAKIRLKQQALADYQLLQENPIVKARLAWYRKHFGEFPAAIDYARMIHVEQFRHEQSITVNAHHGESIPEVERWNILGFFKDVGEFQIKDHRLHYRGSKESLDIPLSEIVSMRETNTQLTIRTLHCGVWRINPMNLWLNDISRQTILAAQKN